jgi:hypothetical protein
MPHRSRCRNDTSGHHRSCRSANIHFAFQRKSEIPYLWQGRRNSLHTNDLLFAARNWKKMLIFPNNSIMPAFNHGRRGISSTFGRGGTKTNLKFGRNSLNSRQEIRFQLTAPRWPKGPCTGFRFKSRRDQNQPEIWPKLSQLSAGNAISVNGPALAKRSRWLRDRREDWTILWLASVALEYQRGAHDHANFHLIPSCYPRIHLPPSRA